MADYFVYNWSDGYKTEVELPEEKGVKDCGHKSPSDPMNSFSGMILADASHGTEEMLNEVEDYLVNAMPVIQTYYNVAVDIKDYWDVLEIKCANYDNWFLCCCNKGRFCYKSEGTLEGYYWSWHGVPYGILEDLKGVQSQLKAVTQQIEVNAMQQQQAANLAYTEAMINKLIAETNQAISIVTYQNESREIALQKKKTIDLFTPVVIILLLVALGIYLYKPKRK